METLTQNQEKNKSIEKIENWPRCQRSRESLQVTTIKMF